MPLSVGDAVLTFLGDTTQLDQAFVRIPEQADASMSAAAASVDKVGLSAKGVSFELDATGSNAAFAGGEIRDSMGGAGASVVQLEEKIRLTKERMAELAEEASITGQAVALVGEAFAGFGDVLVAALGVEAFKSQIEGAQKSILALELLSEKTGIAIDKMAGIEHVSAAAGVAFEQVSTALTKLSRAQILALEGSTAQVAAFKRIGISVEELKTLAPEELFYRVGEAMANASSHSAAAASAFGLLGKGGAALIPIFQQNREELRGMVVEAAKASGVTKDAANSAREWEAQTANLSEAWRSVLIPLMKGAVPVIRAVETAASSVAMIIRDLAAVFGGLGLVFIDQAKAMGAIFDDVIHGNFSKLESDGKKFAETLTHDLGGIGVQVKQEWANTADYIKHVWTDVNPLKPMKDDFSDVAGKQKDLTKVAKSALDEQLANIDAWKAAQHAAYESHQIDLAQWLAAEVHAADAAEIAHEHYLQRLVVLAKQAGDATKIQAAQEELSAFQTKAAADKTDKLATAQEKHRAATQKVVAEYAKLTEAGIDKEFAKTTKAADALTKAEEELAKAQVKLAEDTISQHFRDQEEAITKLAAMHLITEQQKNNRLRLLEQQQADASLKILDDELKKEEKLRDDAQAKLNAAKANPSSSSSELLTLEAELAKENAAVVHAEDAKLKAQEKFNKQSEANDKSHFGRALLLAISYGKDILAEQLKQNHSELLATQQELLLAKARGQDTTAIQLKVVALKQHEQQLEKEANGNKQLIAQHLQLTNQQLLSAQAVLADAKARGQDTTAIEKQIADLKKLQTELQKTTQDTNSLAQAETNLKNESQQMAQALGNAFANAMEQIMTGQKTVGQAAKEMIASMAEQWGKFYIAKGIADMFTDPAAGAIELAEGTALLALGVALGAGGGFGGSGSSPVNNVSSSSNPTGVQQSGSSGGGSNQTVSVTHLATGGLVTGPTRAMIGENGAEAVIPLSDPAALARIAGALLSPSTLRAASPGMASSAAAASAGAPARSSEPIDSSSQRDSSGGGDTHNHFHVEVKGLISPDNLDKVMKRMSARVLKNQSSLHSSNSLRITRRSQ
jgi:hypothetical protein